MPHNCSVSSHEAAPVARRTLFQLLPAVYAASAHPLARDRIPSYRRKACRRCRGRFTQRAYIASPYTRLAAAPGLRGIGAQRPACAFRPAAGSVHPSVGARHRLRRGCHRWARPSLQSHDAPAQRAQGRRTRRPPSCCHPVYARHSTAIPVPLRVWRRLHTSRARSIARVPLVRAASLAVLPALPCCGAQWRGVGVVLPSAAFLPSALAPRRTIVYARHCHS